MNETKYMNNGCKINLLLTTSPGFRHFQAAYMYFKCACGIMYDSTRHAYSTWHKSATILLPSSPWVMSKRTCKGCQKTSLPTMALQCGS